MKRWYLLVLVILVAAVFGYFKMTAQPKPSEEARILEILQKGEAAIENKDSGFTTSCISPNYSDHYGNKGDTMRLLLVELAHDGGTYNVVTKNPVIKVNGDKATATMDVSGSLTGEYSRSFTHPITFEFAKEDAKRWLVFPIKVWRVTSVDYLPEDF